MVFTGGSTVDGGADVRLGVSTYSPAALSFTTPDQGGTGDAYRYASGHPATLADQLGLDSWSNFMQDVNQVSGYVATGAQLVAVGCAVAVVCAPLVPIAGGIALAGTAVNAASGVAMATETCISQKGSCPGAVGVAALGLLGSRFGGGRLVNSIDTAAAGQVDEAFHYTDPKWLELMMSNGLRPGTYATPEGGLSPLQAALDLALPPNRPLPTAVVRIDVAGLRAAGHKIPSVSQVSGTVTGAGGRVYTMPGGGTEMNFPYAIPSEFLKVSR